MKSNQYPATYLANAYI